MASFWKSEAFGQTVLPDRSISKGQKLMENAKIEKLKCDILDDCAKMGILKTWFFEEKLRFCHSVPSLLHSEQKGFGSNYA